MHTECSFNAWREKEGTGLSYGPMVATFKHGNEYLGHVVVSCHQGMARPQVADRGTASDKEDSCK